MNYSARKFFKRILWPVGIPYKLFFCRDSYLKMTGWLKSYRRGCPCRPDGTLLPWMNYSIIALLEQRLHNRMRLFEFGSGYSTLFYAERVKAVTSVEHDPYWYHNSPARDRGNVTLVHVALDTDGEYCRTIRNGKTGYDVVIVDGRDRVNCIIQSVPALSARGVIILDDSQRERYQQAFVFLKKKGFRALDFQGLKPNGTKYDRTTVFYRTGNCFNI